MKRLELSAAHVHATRSCAATGPHTMHTRGFDFECGRDEKRGGYYITG